MFFENESIPFRELRTDFGLASMIGRTKIQAMLGTLFLDEDTSSPFLMAFPRTKHIACYILPIVVEAVTSSIFRSTSMIIRIDSSDLCLLHLT